MAVPKVPKELWDNPAVSTLDVGTTAQNMEQSQKDAIWKKYSTSDKYIAVENIPNLIYDIFIQTIKEKDSKIADDSIPPFLTIEDKLNQITDWIVEAKLDSSTEKQITKLQYKSQFPLWVLEAGRKKIKMEHPSATLLPSGAVTSKSDEFAEQTDIAKSEQFSDAKYKQTNSEEARAKRGTLHGPTRSIFFTEKIESVYSVTKDCYLYSNAELTTKSKNNNGEMIKKGTAVGGPSMNKKLNKKSVEITEPESMKGYISVKYIDKIDITNPKWKFDYPNVNFEHSSQASQHSRQFSNPTDISNNNDDEKMSVEERTCDLGDPNDPQARAALLNTYKQNIQTIKSVPINKRTAEQVTQLWTSAFNTHDIDALKECYSNAVVSQQLVDQQLTGKDDVLAQFSQMFGSSNDIGLNVTNKIISNDMIVLEWKAWGTKTPSPSVSSSDSPKEQSNQNNNNNNNNRFQNFENNSNSSERFINGCGIFHIQQGRISAQRLFWDQDVNWFSEMGVLKIPLSDLGPILYTNRGLPPQLMSLTTKSGDNSNGSDGLNSMEDEIDPDSLEFEILQRRGLIMRDIKQDRLDIGTRKRRQFATGLFWVGVGIMFIYVVPKYLNKKTKYPFPF